MSSNLAGDFGKPKAQQNTPQTYLANAQSKK
jgi:hypothetical protein